MNKVVREHYPVSKLPEDLREQFAGLETVTVVGEDIDFSAKQVPLRHSYEEMIARIKPMSFRELVADKEAHPEKYRGSVTPDEAVARIRMLRDEWDDDR